MNYQYILALAAINVAAFAAVGVDKKKSISLSERVPEIFLFFLAACFGSLGVFLGLFVFRHKTLKLYFVLGIGLILVQQALLLLLLYKSLFLSIQ